MTNRKKIYTNFFLFLFLCFQRASLAVSPWNNGSQRVNAYICLNELTALLSYSAHKAKDIHPLLHVHHVDHAVNDNERPSPPYAGAGRKTTTEGKKKARQGTRSRLWQTLRCSDTNRKRQRRNKAASPRQPQRMNVTGVSSLLYDAAFLASVVHRPGASIRVAPPTPS